MLAILSVLGLKKIRALKIYMFSMIHSNIFLIKGYVRVRNILMNQYQLLILSDCRQTAHQ